MSEPSSAPLCGSGETGVEVGWPCFPPHGRVPVRRLDGSQPPRESVPESGQIRSNPGGEQRSDLGVWDPAHTLSRSSFYRLDHQALSASHERSRRLLICDY